MWAALEQHHLSVSEARALEIVEVLVGESSTVHPLSPYKTVEAKNWHPCWVCPALPQLRANQLG